MNKDIVTLHCVIQRMEALNAWLIAGILRDILNEIMEADNGTKVA